VPLVLHLGVVDLPYTDRAEDTAPKRVPKAAKGKAARPRKPKASAAGGATPNQTTGDVAELLEKKYDVMAGFYKLHANDIAEALADSMAGSLEDLFSGKPAALVGNPLAAAEEAVKEKFQEFLDKEELSGLEEGVPTAAALRGKSSRFKSGRGPRRPSFVDTGLYRESFAAWTEGEL
jgi:hypothetical protein